MLWICPVSTRFSKSAARNLAKYTTAGPEASLASKLFATAVAVVALGVNLGGVRPPVTRDLKG